MTLTIRSSSFLHNEMMPALYTCEGDNISPPLIWNAPPEGTKSLVLIVDDPDAPDPAAPKMTWVHWVLYNLPPEAGRLPAGVTEVELPRSSNLSTNVSTNVSTLLGTNDRKNVGYNGPCPPVGTHRYFHKLYAIDIVLPDLNAPTKADVLARIEGHVLAYAELIGLYRLEGK